MFTTREYDDVELCAGWTHCLPYQVTLQGTMGTRVHGAGHSHTGGGDDPTAHTTVGRFVSVIETRLQFNPGVSTNSDNYAQVVHFVFLVLGQATHRLVVATGRRLSYKHGTVVLGIATIISKKQRSISIY